MITTEFSPELRERWESKPRWEVTLSDGRTVYQVNEGGGDWYNLHYYLKDNPELYIVKMHIGFRDNCYPLPDNADGYFFRCSILATPGWEKHSFIVGVLDGDRIEVEKYELPEMIHLGHESRGFETLEFNKESLICKMNDQISTLQS